MFFHLKPATFCWISCLSTGGVWVLVLVTLRYILGVGTMKHILPVLLASLLLRQHWKRLISDMIRLGLIAIGLSIYVWIRSHSWMQRQQQQQQSQPITVIANILPEYSMECDRMKWGISFFLFLYICHYEIREKGILVGIMIYFFSSSRNYHILS